MTDLGPSGGQAVSGNTVASALPARGATHAAVWKLSRTTKPALRFARFNTRVQENAGRARITVTRAGDPRPAVSVRYATKGIDARPGKDFTATSGILAFAAGQTSRSFTLPIRNDTVPEGPETFMVTLGSPAGGAIRGTPNAAGLIIRASDQRPDAQISTRPTTGYIGNNIYNTTGARQTRTLTAHRAQTRLFHVRVYNDGNTITLTGSKPRPGSGVRYYLGTRDVTRAMR